MGLAITNNNPGNLKDPSTGNFRQFNSPQEGYAALLNDLQSKQTGTSTTGLGPSSSLIDFASKYAPANDKNNVGQYAANLANKMGTRPDAKLKDLDLSKWAAAVASNEDSNSPFGKQKILSSTTGGTNTAQPTPADQDNSFVGDVGNSLAKAGTGVANSITDTISGKINPLSGLIQGAGAIAGGVGDLTNNVLEHTPVVGSLYKGAESAIGQGAQAVAGTDLGQQAMQTYQQFAQAHPELAADIGSGVNIATALPVLKGLGVAKDAVKGAVGAALHGGTDAVLESVAPKLTAGEAAKALAQRGTVQKGILRETQLAPDPYTQKVAASVKSNVPDFKPGDDNLLHNITVTQKVVGDMARKLKQAVMDGGANRIYPKQELIAKLRGIEKPDLIASDATLNNVYDRLIARVQGLADQNGGKVSNLLDLRQQFDQLVKRQYPNLYSSDTLTPLRAGVKDIRDAITNFTANNLPEGTGLKESLLTQHHLLTAVENMSEKATKGSTKQIGTNVLSRFGNRHPIIRGLVNAGTKAAVEGTGIGAAMRVLQ